MERLVLRAENGDSMHLRVGEEVMQEFCNRVQPGMSLTEQLQLVNQILEELKPSTETEAQLPIMENPVQ